MSHRKLTAHPLRSLLRSTLARTAAGALGAAAPLAVLANPTGGQVVGGSATIGSAGANGVVINQSSQKAIINWQQFSVGSGQYVQFVQPDSSAVILNRVTGNNPSSIFGDIIANGQVFLVNPNGVYFAPGASIDVQGLVASTLDLNDTDFMQGRYVFSKAPGAPDAGVVNAGSIHAGPGGYVVLAGDYARNSGAIVAQTGRVYLAAGNAATLTFDNNGLISYVVDGKTLSRVAGVSNTGEIAANGGRVVMTADVANTLTATAVNNSGLITAHSVRDEGGQIVLLAQGGDIENSGTLDASANTAGVAGGTVIVRGDGTTRLDPGSLIETGGDGAAGGFVELSGHHLSIKGTVDPGRGGNLLIDPSSLNITSGASAPGTTGNIGVGYIQSELNSGVDVVLVASNAIGHAANLTALSATGTGNLTIKTGSLAVTAGAGSLSSAPGSPAFSCKLSGVCQPGSGFSFTPTNGAINLGGMTIAIKGAFTADAQAGLVTVSNVTADGGISLTGSKITAGALSASAGNVLITGKRTASGTTSISQTGLLKGKSVTVTENLTGTSSVSYGGHISLGSVDATAGGISIAATVNGAKTTITTGNLTASRDIKVSQHGRSGSVHLGSVSAGGSSGGSLHAAVHITTTDTSASGGSGNISAAKITAAGGGVLIQANAGGNSGGNIHALVIAGPSITLNATAKKGGDISVGTLHATGTGGISLYGHATGGVSSSGGRITVNGNISASRGAVKVDALGGLDSGGHINVHGSINAAGDVKLLAVGLGSCCDGNISISAGVTGNFIDIESRNTNTTATSGATIRINGSVKATGTAPSASPNLGVTIDAGSSHARHGAPQITVTGNITASHAAVNLNLWGSASGGRSIAVGQSVAGVWTNGAIKAQRVNIQAHGSAGGAAVTTGNITAAGKVSIVADGKGRSGVGIKVGSVTAQSVSFSGSDKLGGAASLIAGKIAATKLNVSATANAATGQVATISLGSIHGVNASGGASIDLNAVGGTTSLTLGPIAVGGSLTLKSKGALDLSSATIQAGKDMTLQAGGTVTLTGAHVQAGGQVTLLAGQHILLGLTKVKAGGAFSADAHGSISDGGSGGSITAAGATFKAATGKVRLDGETLNIGTSKLAFSAAGSVALNNAHIHAGSMTVAAVGNLNMTSASIHAAGMQVVTGGSIDLSGDTMVVTGAVKLTAGLVAANQPLAAKDIVLSGVTITVGTLSADAGGTIHNGGAVGTITANGLALTAGKDITLSSTQITVGNGSVASLGSDPLLLQALATVGLSPASPRPNAYFNAGGTLTLGKFTLNGDYLYMQAANITLLGPVTAPTKSVIQFAPTTGPASIGVEQTPGTGSVLNLSNSLLLSLFPGTTLVIGNGTESGAVTLGSSGPIDIGSSNLIVETSGTVTGLSNIISTGLVSTVQSLLASVLPPPTPSEIDPNSSNNNNTAGKHRQQGDYDPDGGGTGGGTITQTTDTGGACH